MTQAMSISLASFTSFQNINERQLYTKLCIYIYAFDYNIIQLDDIAHSNYTAEFSKISVFGE